ncbi:Crp/Fnr family transcriptional regulator [Emticicia sp. C21]|uniref:Crp/Fnr family transcriptional regulator n=1 Tax=Emticicia sp. C21 TaxID=2302915 RepID=UPI000E350B38|nr:Crp/Fnr family transcriptional regulator [Emticicia sp. C21]RFS15504.1 Crp/Fnr family transcriptional regulator [Emticicia sp. C21]
MDSQETHIQSEWQKFSHLFKREEVPAKTILLKEGEIAKKIYFIEKGCFRLSLNNDGTDITFQFFFEGEGISSAESFRYNQPSLYSIESLEPSIVHSLTKADYLTIIENSPLIKQNIEEQTVQRLLYIEKLFLSRIKNSPEKRYKELLEQYPKILQRVPQHYIASFLGITSVSLSRIRNRR